MKAFFGKKLSWKTIFFFLSFLALMSYGLGNPEHMPQKGKKEKGNIEKPLKKSQKLQNKKTKDSRPLKNLKKKDIKRDFGNPVKKEKKNTLSQETLQKVEEGLKGLSPKEVSQALRFAIIMLGMTLLPIAAMIMTSFTRILIVLSFFREALSAREALPTTVLFGLSLLLSILVMMPTANKIYEKAVLPWLDQKISLENSLEKGKEIWKNFMLAQTQDQELLLFLQIQNQKPPKFRHQLKFHQVLPAFVVGEIRKAFEMGILIYIPFVMLDLLVGLSLYSLGIQTLSAQTISFVLKMSVFILADGWSLLVAGILRSFH